MTKETFAKGIAILKACVVKFETDEKKIAIWYELTKEISDRTYMKAIEKISKNGGNIYPGTNIVALIRKTADEVRDESNAPSTLQLGEGYTPEQFEDGRKRLRLIIEKVGRK